MDIEKIKAELRAHSRFPYTYCYDFLRGNLSEWSQLSRSDCSQKMKELIPDESLRLKITQDIAEMHIEADAYRVYGEEKRTVLMNDARELLLSAP